MGSISGTTMRALELVVHGDVQGVGFRHYTQQTARELGLEGWVRNAPDGTVEVHVQGHPEMVRSMVLWLQEGPPMAQVSRVERREVAPDPQLHGFGVKG